MLYTNENNAIIMNVRQEGLDMFLFFVLFYFIFIY